MTWREQLEAARERTIEDLMAIVFGKVGERVGERAGSPAGIPVQLRMPPASEIAPYAAGAGILIALPLLFLMGGGLRGRRRRR